MSHMDRALSLARRALGPASPNPSVGAVIVKGSAVVGEGWTQPPGGPHAELVALREADADAAGATLYTTLEPCNHHGRTPPCTQAIVDAGIAAVHVAVHDPNPNVEGGGLELLQRSGIDVTVGEGEDEARVVMEAYLKFVTTGVPFVTARFATSLDGKLATRTGDSRWISSEESRRYAHGMRAVSDAILAGINTVVVDDPQLTARDESGSPLDRQPLRVIVDSRGRTPGDARLLSEPGRTLVAVASVDDATRRRLIDMGVDVESAPGENGAVDLAELLRRLGRRNVTSVMVEGGGTILGSLFDRGLVDKVVAWVAPTIIGGRDAPVAVGGLGAEKIADALKLDRVEVVQMGRDVAIIGYP